MCSLYFPKPEFRRAKTARPCLIMVLYPPADVKRFWQRASLGAPAGLDAQEVPTVRSVCGPCFALGRALGERMLHGNWSGDRCRLPCSNLIESDVHPGDFPRRESVPGFCLVGFLFVIPRRLPETRGKTLGEIEKDLVD